MPDAPRPEADKFDTTARLLRIHGRVQGVCYRASAQDEAVRLGLAGWVRNRADGTVEALVAGAEAIVEQFIDWARRGPPAARVERIEIAVAEAPDRGAFEVRATQ